jgi:hypothetical protein
VLTVASCSGCGTAGSPGGSNTDVQFNNAGSFGALSITGNYGPINGAGSSTDYGYGYSGGNTIRDNSYILPFGVNTAGAVGVVGLTVGVPCYLEIPLNSKFISSAVFGTSNVELTGGIGGSGG